MYTRISAFALLTVFVAGSRQANAAASVQLHLWHGMEGATAQWFASEAESFRRLSNIEVSIQAEVDVEAALFRQEESEVLPDIVLVPSNLCGLARELKLSAVPEQWLADMAQGSVQSVIPTDAAPVARGIPLFLSDVVLLFRNSLLAPVSPGSLQQLLTSNFATIAIDRTTPFLFIPLLTGLKAWPNARDGFSFPPVPFAQALKIYQDLDPLVAGGRQCDAKCARDLFYGGKVAFWWGLGASRREARRQLGSALAIDALPAVVPGGTPMQSLAGTYALVFPNDSLRGKKTQAIQRFIHFLLQPSEQKQVLVQAGRIPALAKLPVAAFDADDLALLRQLRTQVPLPNSRATAALWPALRKILRSNTQQRIADPAKAMNDLITSSMDRFRWPEYPVGHDQETQ